MKKSKKSGASIQRKPSIKTIEDFEAEYKPMVDILDEGSYLLDYDLASNVGVDSSQIWTLVSADGKEIIMAGRHYVNRIAYIITEKPWTTGNEEFIFATDNKE